jgi:hypothetical protein
MNFKILSILVTFTIAAQAQIAPAVNQTSLNGTSTTNATASAAPSSSVAPPPLVTIPASSSAIPVPSSSSAAIPPASSSTASAPATETSAPATVAPAPVTPAAGPFVRKVTASSISSCRNNEKGEAIATFTFEDQSAWQENGQTSFNSPSAAKGGLVDFTVDFTNPAGGDWIFVSPPTEGPADPSKYGANAKFDKKLWTFTEVEGQTKYGGEFKFLNVKSCINGVLTPQVQFKITASVNGGSVMIIQ